MRQSILKHGIDFSLSEDVCRYNDLVSKSNETSNLEIETHWNTPKKESICRMGALTGLVLSAMMYEFTERAVVLGFPSFIFVCVDLAIYSRLNYESNKLERSIEEDES